MKAAAFEYHAPTSIDEALALLAEHGASARLIAGGQSLVPAMLARREQPSHLVDVNRIARAERPRIADGRLHIPHLMRHVDFEAPLDGPLGACLAALAKTLGQLPVRLRGTFCGAIAQGDPAGEWCTASVVLGADILIRSAAGGARRICAEDFFGEGGALGVAPEEMVVAVEIPLLPPTARWGMYKVARCTGGIGEAIALCVFDLDAAGLMTDPRVGVGGVGPTPQRLSAVEAALAGHPPDETSMQRAGRIAAETLQPTPPPTDDATAGTAYRQALGITAVQRALAHCLI